MSSSFSSKTRAMRRSEIRLRGGLVARVEATEIELDERLPATRGGVELLELAERLVVRGVDLEDLLPRERRLVGLLDRLAPELGDLTVLLDLRRRLFERGRALHLDVDDLGPLLLAAVDRLEGVHRLEVGTDLEELPPCVGGVVRLRELLAVDLTELAVDLLELLAVEHRRGAIHHLVEGGDELLRVALTTTDRGDRAEAGEVRVVDVEDAVPVLEREVVALELALEGARATREDVHAIVVGLGDVELTLEDVDELAPRLLLLVEVRERGERLGILAAKIEDDLPRVDGARRIVEPLGGEVRELRADLGLLRRRPTRSRARARRPC